MFPLWQNQPVNSEFQTVVRHGHLLSKSKSQNNLQFSQMTASRGGKTRLFYKKSLIWDNSEWNPGILSKEVFLQWLEGKNKQRIFLFKLL